MKMNANVVVAGFCCDFFVFIYFLLLLLLLLLVFGTADVGFIGIPLINL
jgi:hypothetical protein